MDDNEILALFSGYGYQVRLVEYGVLSESGEETEKQILALNKNMAVSMEWALQEIRKIQQAARSDKPIVKPRWPLIIMRTPKVSPHHHVNSQLLALIPPHRSIHNVIGNDRPY